MATVQYTPSISILTARLSEHLSKFTSGSSEVRNLLETIGSLMTEEAINQAESQNITDTLQLVASIRYAVRVGRNKATVTVATSRNYYAIFQEMGAFRTEASRRAMFAALRERGVQVPSRAPRPGFTRFEHPARPFMQPAFQLHAHRVREMLVSIFREGL